VDCQPSHPLFVDEDKKLTVEEGKESEVFSNRVSMDSMDGDPGDDETARTSMVAQFSNQIRVESCDTVNQVTDMPDLFLNPEKDNEEGMWESLFTYNYNIHRTCWITHDEEGWVVITITEEDVEKLGVEEGQEADHCHNMENRETIQS
jgi:hypothetical protein